MNAQVDSAVSDEVALADHQAALFAQLVTGHGQMALMFLGKLPNPQTGSVEMPILEAARTFIDQLEMLEKKTRGNISPNEIRILEETLSFTRVAFVEVVAALNRADSDASQPAVE